jgi:predicted chitinase
MTKSNDKSLGNLDANKDHKKVAPLVVSCACNRDITLDELADGYPDRKKDTLEKFLDSLNLAMNRYEIRSCLRKAHFLAQVGHESSELKYTAEVLENGITEEKAYKGYKGRGLIQLTGEDNYLKYGTYIKQDLLNGNKFEVEKPKLASDSAGWFWQLGRGEDLNHFADKNDALYITAAINGAFNGYEGQATSRLTLLKNLVASFHVNACPQLDALFSAAPEAEKFNYDSYPLEKSKAFDIPDMAFAWGLWHDPKSKNHGMRKDITQAKLGYKRYLELMEDLNISKNKKRGRFGFKGRPEMTKHAEAALK